MAKPDGKYIYCIIKENAGKTLGPIGIDNQEVSLLNYKDISAVVSSVSSAPIINFGRLDKKELTKLVAVHQKVNEEVMKNYDVCPMAFGIIAPSANEALSILEKAYLQFKTAFKNIINKVEFAVQVSWDQKKFLEEIANTNSEIQKLREEVVAKGSILGLPIKLKLGKLIHQEVETQRQSFIDDTHAFLMSSSRDSTLNKLIDEEMIANFSFLIERAKEAELDQKMQELGKKYEGELKFKYIGPMPPYSFVNINLRLGNFELVDGARKLLKLAGSCTFNEIKKAYYILAHQYHPDKYQGNQEKEEYMKKITQAYGVLENYCQSRDEFTGKVEGQRYSFKKEDVENSLIIK